MERQDIIRNKLEEKGLTVQQAAKLCGVTGATMTVLEDGWQTIPSLAIKVARGLELTQEEARKIGHVLSRSRWETVENTKVRGLDFNPRWYTKLDKVPEEEKQYNSFSGEMDAKRKTRQKKTHKYINILVVSEWAAGRMTNCTELVELVTGQKLYDINRESALKGRDDYIRKVADTVGMTFEEITLDHKPAGRDGMDVRYLGNVEKLLQAAKELDVSMEKASKRHGVSGTFASSVLDRSKMGTLFAPATARKMAEILEKDFYELFIPRWVQPINSGLRKRNEDGSMTKLSEIEKKERKEAYMKKYREAKREGKKEWTSYD